MRIAKPKKTAPIDIMVYIGDQRPFGNSDYGLKLILELEKNNFNITVLIRECDPINQHLAVSAVKVKKVLYIPDVLTLRKHEIAEMLKKREISEKIDTWVGEIKKLNIDLGIVFFGYWVPPELFNVPKWGFINYHPGPLPFLKGMEPDTFIILEGWRKVWGAVHKVVSDFDEGNIIAKTKLFKVSKYATPVAVLHALSDLGIEAIVRAVKNIQNNKPPHKLKEGTLATVKMAQKESVIRWDKDTTEIIDRKLRAFCGQDIKIRLKAVINGKLYFIYDLETYRLHKKCIQQFGVGTLMGLYLQPGKYYHKPIVKTIDGAVVLFAHEDSGIPERDLCFTEENIIPPHKRNYETNYRMVEDSIRAFAGNP